VATNVTDSCAVSNVFANASLIPIIMSSSKLLFIVLKKGPTLTSQVRSAGWYIVSQNSTACSFFAVLYYNQEILLTRLMPFRLRQNQPLTQCVAVRYRVLLAAYCRVLQNCSFRAKTSH